MDYNRPIIERIPDSGLLIDPYSSTSRVLTFKDGIARNKFTIVARSIVWSGGGSRMDGYLYGSMTGAGVPGVPTVGVANVDWYLVGTALIDNVASGSKTFSGVPALFLQWVWGYNTEGSVTIHVVASGR